MISYTQKFEDVVFNYLLEVPANIRDGFMLYKESDYHA